MEQFRGTTICSVRRGKHVVIVGDGQVSLGNTVLKSNAKKVRRIYHDKVLVGFAGGTADAFTLFERFEGKLEQHNGQIQKAAVEMAKDWRQDRALRRLEAMMIVADETATLIISGNGDVVRTDDDLCAIGSGGMYALSAAKALFYNTDLNPREVGERALNIAADICVFTNHELTIEELGQPNA